MGVDMNGCTTCGAQLGRRNKSGYCKRHSGAAMWRAAANDSEFREKQRAGIKRALMLRPEKLAAMRARLIKYNKSDENRARAAKAMKAARLWEKSPSAPAGSESRIRAGKRSTETRMAWCPRELRDDYRRLVYSKKVPAAEARAIILEHHERYLAKFRASIAA